MDIEQNEALVGGAAPSFRQSAQSLPVGIRNSPPTKPHNLAVRPREHLLEAEVEAMIKATSGRTARRDSALILIAFRHGLRAQEICRLQWSSIVLEGKATTIHINRAKGGSSARSSIAWPRDPGAAGMEPSAGRPLAVRVYLDARRALVGACCASDRSDRGASRRAPIRCSPSHAPPCVRIQVGGRWAGYPRDPGLPRPPVDQQTVRYTELAPGRFESFWND